MVRSLAELAEVYCWLNQPAKAEPLVAEALAICTHLGTPFGRMPGLCSLPGLMYNYLGEMEKKQAMAERGLALARELDENWAIGLSLRKLANIAMVRDDFEEAHRLYAEVFQTVERMGIRVTQAWPNIVPSLCCMEGRRV